MSFFWRCKSFNFSGKHKKIYFYFVEEIEFFGSTFSSKQWTHSIELGRFEVEKSAVETVILN